MSADTSERAAHRNYAQTCEDIVKQLLLAPRADKAVELSQHIPLLLEIAAEQSTNLQALIDPVATSSSSSSNRGSSRAGSSGRQGGDQADTHTNHPIALWSGSVAGCVTLTKALRRTSRLPQQQAMDYILAADSVRQQLKWMADMAGRILQHNQLRPTSNHSSSSSSSHNKGATANTGSSSGGSSLKSPAELLDWPFITDQLLSLYRELQGLHAQCSLAVATGSAHSSSSSSSRGAAAGGSGGSSWRWSSSKQPGKTSRAAPGAGCSWDWGRILKGFGPEDLSMAVSMQSQACWLHPSLVRLTDAFLRHAGKGDPRADPCYCMAFNWVDMLMDSRAVLDLMGPGASASAVAAAAAELCSKRLLVLQEVAWGCLATGSQVLRDMVPPLVPRAAPLRHPTLGWCPRYHSSRSYATGLMPHLRINKLQSALMASRAGLRLATAQVWHLWSWQMEMEQVLQRQEPVHGAAAGKHTKQCSRDCVAMRDQVLSSQQRRHGQQSKSSTSTRGASPTVSSSSSSGSSSSIAAPQPTMVQFAVQLLLPRALPLLPGSSSKWPASPSCQMPPVTLKLMQLALEQVCLAVEWSPQDARSSLMLMVLQLLRAEPALRLAFLQGPWGGLLLAALQLYACGRTRLHREVEAAVPGLAPLGPVGMPGVSSTGGMGLLTTSMFGDTTVLNVTDSAALLLSFVYLEPMVPDGPCSHGTPAAPAAAAPPAAAAAAAAAAAGSRQAASQAQEPVTSLDWKDHGNQLLLAGQYQAALDSYQRSLALGPTSIAHANAAMALLKLNKHSEAEAACTAALALQPEYVKALQRRGAARKALGSYWAAVEDFEAALQLEPRNKQVQAERDACRNLYQQQQRGAFDTASNTSSATAASSKPAQQQPLGLPPLAASAARTSMPNVVTSSSSSSRGGASGSSGSSGCTLSPSAVSEYGAWAPNWSLQIGTGGALMCIKGDAARLQLVPGYAANLQFAATLEVLWHKGDVMASAPTAALASAWEADPSRAPPPTSPMWLALASMAVGVRKAAVSLNSSATIDQQQEKVHRTVDALLPLVRLAAVAMQQPGAGWGALVLGSAVQGAALTCCAAAVDLEGQHVAHNMQGPMQTGILDQLRQHRQQGQFDKQAVLQATASVSSICKELCALVLSSMGQPPAAAGLTAAAPSTPPKWSPTYPALINLLHRLMVLKSSWPDGPGGPLRFVFGAGQAAPSRPLPPPAMSPPAQSSAAALVREQLPSLAHNSQDQVIEAVRDALSDAACVIDVCDVVEQCACACSSTIQLLGCAYLGCTTQPPGGLSSCEATLVVNRKGSVCGGCGVVRYCSAACAQKDWAGHRRVCRKLAAAAAAGDAAAKQQ